MRNIMWLTPALSKFDGGLLMLRVEVENNAVKWRQKQSRNELNILTHDFSGRLC